MIKQYVSRSAHRTEDEKAGADTKQRTVEERSAETST